MGYYLLISLCIISLWVGGIYAPPKSSTASTVPSTAPSKTSTGTAQSSTSNTTARDPPTQKVRMTSGTSFFALKNRNAQVEKKTLRERIDMFRKEQTLRIDIEVARRRKSGTTATAELGMRKRGSKPSTDQRKEFLDRTKHLETGTAQLATDNQVWACVPGEASQRVNQEGLLTNDAFDIIRTVPQYDAKGNPIGDILETQRNMANGLFRILDKERNEVSVVTADYLADLVIQQPKFDEIKKENEKLKYELEQAKLADEKVKEMETKLAELLGEASSAKDDVKKLSKELDTQSEIAKKAVEPWMKKAGELEDQIEALRNTFTSAVIVVEGIRTELVSVEIQTGNTQAAKPPALRDEDIADAVYKKVQEEMVRQEEKAKLDLVAKENEYSTIISNKEAAHRKVLSEQAAALEKLAKESAEYKKKAAELNKKQKEQEEELNKLQTTLDKQRQTESEEKIEFRSKIKELEEQLAAEEEDHLTVLETKLGAKEVELKKAKTETVEKANALVADVTKLNGEHEKVVKDLQAQIEKAKQDEVARLQAAIEVTVKNIQTHNTEYVARVRKEDASKVQEAEETAETQVAIAKALHKADIEDINRIHKTENEELRDKLQAKIDKLLVDRFVNVVKLKQMTDAKKRLNLVLKDERRTRYALILMLYHYKDLLAQKEIQRGQIAVDLRRVQKLLMIQMGLNSNLAKELNATKSTLLLTREELKKVKEDFVREAAEKKNLHKMIEDEQRKQNAANTKANQALDALAEEKAKREKAEEELKNRQNPTCVQAFWDLIGSIIGHERLENISNKTTAIAQKGKTAVTEKGKAVAEKGKAVLGKGRTIMETVAQGLYVARQKVALMFNGYMAGKFNKYMTYAVSAVFLYKMAVLMSPLYSLLLEERGRFMDPSGTLREIAKPTLALCAHLPLPIEHVIDRCGLKF
ncbi:hypothetical protein DdX_12948 [Ditylenchus destructor]|uniref:Uncharacterized protein n=1 Tax=Ditylenchus destructor TaxID=166010 RepID=A0AAD4MTP8_9BILA|nr:hypothetical protein DdX_12948 [Ditylenchus destructor]